jgi:hypothetical protein
MNIGGYKGHPFLKKKPEKREFKERENKGKQGSQLSMHI